MSEKSVNELFDETKARLNGFAMLYYYHLCNLCIKADTMALLAVTAEVDDATCNLEDVADVCVTDDYTFVVIPKSQEYLLPIAKSIKLEHPEFKIEEKAMKNELTGEEDIVFYYTMPEVNEDRRDLCMDYIQTRYDFAKTKMDGAFSVGTAKITARMAGASEEQVSNAKDRLQEVYDYYDKMCNRFRDDKIKEVEEGYQKYLAEQTEASKQTAEKQAAEGQQNVFSMNMGEDDE